MVVQGAGFIALRQFLRLHHAFRTGAGAPFPQGPQYHAAFQIKSAGALGAQQPLVPGKGVHVAAQLFNVHRHAAQGLGSVYQIKQARFPGDFSRGGHGLNGAGDVGSMGQNQKPGAGGYGPADFFGVDHALFSGAQQGHGNLSPLFQSHQYPQHGIVL